MDDPRDIVYMHNEFYRDDYKAWGSFYECAAHDLKMYLGDQWSDEEKEYLAKEHRNSFVFNKIRRSILMITGYQRKNRLSSIVVPVENSDQETADLRSELLLQIYSQENAYNTFSDTHAGSAKTGINLSTLWVDYREDPVNGDVKFGREGYSGFIVDPYFTKLDFSDCSHVMRRKFLGVDQAVSFFPKHKKEIRDLHRTGWNQDDKFTWLPYKTQPSQKELLAVDEFYVQKWEEVPVVVDMETGKYFKWEGDRAGLEKIKQLYSQIKVIMRPTRYIEKHIIVNNEFILTEKNPYGLDEYPFAPSVAIFEPESNDWSLKIQSLVRPQIDPQREKNKRISQMTDIQDSQINSGWIATEGAVANKKSLFQSSQGRVIWKSKNSAPGALEKIQPGRIDASYFQMHDLFDREMVEILGLNEASYGVPNSGSESGFLMAMRQQAALSNLQDVIDNWAYTQKLISLKVLKIIQNWTPEKIERMTGKKPTDAFYDPESTKYDVRVQGGLLSETQQQIHYAQLVELKQITGGENSPITASDLIRAAPLQDKSSYLKTIEEREKAASEKAQQQTQKQEAIQKDTFDSQKALTKSQEVSNYALAGERNTRGLSNLGLKSEREAEAVENRSQSKLNRAKAFTEIASLGDERFFRWLEVMRELEESDLNAEKLIQQKNVLVSGAVSTGTADQGQQEPQQEPQQESQNINQNGG